MALGWLAGATIAGGLLSAGASSSAAGDQAAAAEQATQLQRDIWQQQQQNLAPWMNQGQLALSDLSRLMGIGSTSPAVGTVPVSTATTGPQPLGPIPLDIMNLLKNPTKGFNLPVLNKYFSGKGYTPDQVQQLIRSVRTTGTAQLPDQQKTAPPAQSSGTATFDPNAQLVKPFTLADFQADPGYQFQLQQGQQAIGNYAAAHGMSGSPGTLKDLATFTTGLAGQDYGAAFNRYMAQNQNIYNMLSGMSDTGANTAGGIANLGTAAASNIGNYLTQGANATAAGTIGSANAINSTIGNLTNDYMMSQLFAGNTNPIDMSQVNSPLLSSPYSWGAP